ncbi:MAG: hypothetical protein ACF8PG_10260 [Maioricimonas sp. JB045]
MNAGVAAAAAAGASAASVMQAIRASGVLVRIEPHVFRDLLERQDEPLVVHATSGLFTTYYQYLMSYRGLAFFTKSDTPIDLPRGTELIVAQRIMIPG